MHLKAQKFEFLKHRILVPVLVLEILYCSGAKFKKFVIGNEQKSHRFATPVQEQQKHTKLDKMLPVRSRSQCIPNAD